MGSAGMSKRAHFWIRLAAVVVIAASAWLPRTVTNGASAGMQSADAQPIHATVAGR
jgi:hypothetical protein